MIYVENVPIIIAETGETARATIGIYEISVQKTVLVIMPKSTLDYTYKLTGEYHIRIGKYNICVYCYRKDSLVTKFVQSDASLFSVEEWECILKNEADKAHTVKDTTVEEKLLKELNKYFKSDECMISYRDANKIEEIIANVLNGE